MKTYFKRFTISSGKEEDVENKINTFINSIFCKEVFSITITPEHIEKNNCNKYIYHICIVYF